MTTPATQRDETMTGTTLTPQPIDLFAGLAIAGFVVAIVAGAYAANPRHDRWPWWGVLAVLVFIVGATGVEVIA